MQRLFAFTALGLLLLSSCGKNGKDTKEQIPTVPGTKVLVLCEGNFQWANASFDLYFPDSPLLVSDVFKNQNGGNILGDVLQSGTKVSDAVWLVLNNSGKLVAVNVNTFALQKEIKGLKSPRYLLPLDGGSALVSDLYENKIAKVSLQDGKILSHVACPGWTENLLVVEDNIAVASANGWVYWLNKSGTTMVDSTRVKSGCKWLCADKNNKLWALASDSGRSDLYRLHGTTHAIEKHIALTGIGFAHKLAMSKNKDSIFFLANGLFAMPISANTAPSVALFNVNGLTYYGLGIDPYSGNIYVANAKDYVSKGEVLVLHGNGKVKDLFQTGINPGEFVFYR